MSASVPAWPCRHVQPCRDEATHWAVCGLDYPEDDLNDPVCETCGWPGGSCMCNDDGERYDAGVLVRDEVVVKQKPGHVVVQLSEEALKALRMLGEPYDDPDTYAHARGRACVLLARDLADVLKEPPC